jgi:hypothetical protein
LSPETIKKCLYDSNFEGRGKKKRDFQREKTEVAIAVRLFFNILTEAPLVGHFCIDVRKRNTRKVGETGALFMISLSGFRHIQNSNGDRASPWYIPHFIATSVMVLLFTVKVVFH